MKGQTQDERDRILAIAGNPHNALVEPLKSIKNGFRILQRTYFYDKNKKRSANNKKAIAVVIDDKYLSLEEYHNKYTRRGNLRKTINEDKHANKSQNDIESCIYQRMLGCIPILYKTAINCKIVENLHAVYGEIIGNKILSLAFHWIQERDNAARRFIRFSNTFVLPFLGRMNEEDISRLYSGLGFDKKSLSLLFLLRCKLMPENSCVSYDSTSIPTKASDIYYRKISKSKIGLYEPMIHFSILTDNKTGIPFFYSLYNGNEPDFSTIEDLMKKISEFAGDNNNITFVFDRGYETIGNLTACLKENKRCIMAARVLNQNIIQEAKEKCLNFNSSSTIIPGTNIHGHTEEISTKYRGNNYKLWVHIYKDECKAANETARFLKKLDDFEKLWRNSSKSERNKMRQNSIIQFFRDTDNGSSICRLTEEIDNKINEFGFFANISTFEASAEYAYKKYVSRDSIEKCFESGKMNINIDTCRSHFQDTLSGRFVIGFVALIILSEIKYQLSKERVFSDKRRKSIPAHFYTMTDIIDITRGITINYAQKSDKYWIGGAIKEIKNVCLACGVDDDLYSNIPEYINNINSIIIN